MRQRKALFLAAAVVVLASVAGLFSQEGPRTRSKETARFFPMAVWYGGGKARAPMLEGQARSKKEIWRK
ncbi:hypothetical protein NP569_27590, partial [Vibrio parahaemolyticus]|nr:hypothetical protein [Vibrio parahaemolyticus]